MDCILIETSAYTDLQAHVQRLLERVSALQGLTGKSPTVRWLTADDVARLLVLPNALCNIIGLAVSSLTRPSATK